MEKKQRRIDWPSLIGWVRSHFLQNRLLVIDFVYLAVMVVLACVFFNHYDTSVTTIQSNYLMDLIARGQGHDFYTIVNEGWNTLDPLPYSEISKIPLDDQWLYCPAIYPIISYLFYGLWNLVPHLLFLLFGSTTSHAAFFLIWAKVLEVICAVACSHFIAKICQKITGREIDFPFVLFYFLSSMGLVFGSFIFNQIDIFYMTFFVIGLYLIYAERPKLGFLFIGLSAAFKYFTLLPGLCLLVAICRKPKSFLLSALCMVVPIVACSIPFIGNLGYQQANYIRDFGTRLVDMGFTGGFAQISLFVLGAGFALIMSFVHKTKPNDPFLAWICFASFAAIIVLTNFNPQWFVMIVPSLTMMVMLSSRKTITFLLETLVGAAYFFAVIVSYSGAVDANMLLYGFVQSLTNRIITKRLSLAALYFDRFGFTSNVLAALFFSVLVASIVAILVLNFDMVFKKKDEEQRTSELPRGLILLRSLVPLLYIVPCLMLYFGSYPLNSWAFDASAYKILTPIVLHLDNMSIMNDHYLYVDGYAFRNDQINVGNKYTIVLDDPMSDQDYFVNADPTKRSDIEGAGSWKADCGFYAMFDISSCSKGTKYDVYIVMKSNGESILINTDHSYVF